MEALELLELVDANKITAADALNYLKVSNLGKKPHGPHVLGGPFELFGITLSPAVRKLAYDGLSFAQIEKIVQEFAVDTSGDNQSPKKATITTAYGEGKRLKQGKPIGKNKAVAEIPDDVYMKFLSFVDGKKC